MEKLIIAMLILICLIGVGFVLHLNLNTEQEDELKYQKPQPPFQGPVPEGYDLEYYQETGITKLKE